MNLAIHDKRLRRASEIICMVLESADGKMLRTAEDSGCLEEFEYVFEECRAWLDELPFAQVNSNQKNAW